MSSFKKTRENLHCLKELGNIYHCSNLVLRISYTEKQKIGSHITNPLQKLTF